MKTKRLLLILSLCYGLNLFGQIPSNIPQNGLVAYYPFNGNANDISGSGNNGIINGELFSTENRFQEPGSAYLFTEGGSGITFQNNNIVFGPQDLTISFWFKRQNCVLPCSNNTFFQTDVIDTNPFDNIVGNQKLSIGIINEKIYVDVFTFEGVSFVQVFSNANNISFNSWIHLTLIIKAQNGGMGSNVGIYINGILDSMMLINYLIPDGSNPQSFSIGSGIDNSNTFNGLIDDFVIYNRELQPNEISQLSSSVNDDIINNNPVPPGIPYQAVARNYQGEPISNSNVQVRFNIRDLNSEGSVVYSETHSLQTDTLGLFSTAIGSGTPSNNGNFNQINWSQTVKYLQVELDFGNGWTDFGTQQLMSVPFALYAGNSQPGPQGPAGPRGITGLTGLDGPQGEQGVAGTNGKNSLVKTSVEPSGATCPSGGVKMEHGLDTNNDGVLDESEINATLTQYVCNGLVGPQGTNGGSGFNHYIGEYFGGGVIYHLWKDDSGVEHGLIVDITDLINGQAWSNVSTTLIGSSADSLFNGLSNSNAIVGQNGHINSAAAICLNSTNGGQNDWYLPSIQEFNMLWKNYYDILRSFSQIPGATQMISRFPYWTSMEHYDGNRAFYFSFYDGSNDRANKNLLYYVRAIRSF